MWQVDVVETNTRREKCRMIDLTSDYPFWLVQNGLLKSYPPLTCDRNCEIAIVGGGVTGALLAVRLISAGYSVILLDAREIGWGSTAASTALLQYELDISLIDLAEKIGQNAACRAYRSSHAALQRLDEILQPIAAACGYSRKQSLYVSTVPGEDEWLQAEAEARRQCGIDVEYLNSRQIEERYRISVEGGLASPFAAACDPLRTTHELLRLAEGQGAEIYDRTQVVEFEPHETGVRLYTHRGPRVSCQRVVLALGYQAQSLLKEPIVQLVSTYAGVTRPLHSLSPWNSDWLLWETNQPYMYLRVTEDGRLLVGGEDDPVHDPRQRARRLARKKKRLERRLGALLPDVEPELEFFWGSTFGQTKDALAYIGESPEFPQGLFALGYGGNGITLSALAADLILARLQGQTHPDADLYRFGR